MVSAVMVTSSFLPGRGGIESYLAELCELVAPRLAVLAPRRREGRELPTDLPYPVSPGPGSMLWPGREVVDAVAAEAARHGTERVLFGTPWPLALIGPSLRRRGLRYAVIVHGAELVVPAAVPVLSRRLARALAEADLVLPVSDYTGRAVAKLLRTTGHEVPQMHTLRARVDLDRFRPLDDHTTIRSRLGLPTDAPLVLCFGRLVPRKGVHRLIDVMPEIARRVPGAVGVVGGTGPEERKLRRQAERSGAPVTFLGRVSEEDAPALYATADVFALPVVDRWFGLEIEGLGVVLLEASACRTPCVTGSSGGTPEAVVDGETGFVVDASDESMLTGAIVRLLTDEELRTRLGAAARKHVELNFSEAAMPRALLEWLG